ncbi:CsgG/HfaB family protein [Alkanindiges sp. WGS2144]|uniref:CsgG/HfaB family protein n=1 Tax=Alkanindiges sp. WGS2144 TaxID=3366808 RepID=UPI003752CAAE
MKKIVCGVLLALAAFPALATIQEVMQEATGSGSTRQQAIAEALLTAAQSVNGTVVSPGMDMAEQVSMVVTNNGWNYQSKSSPVFSVNTQTNGTISRFQVLSVSGSGKSYTARVRAYIPKYQSSVADSHLRRMAVMPFQVMSAKFDLANGDDADDFVTELADLIGTQLTNSRQLSLLSRDYIGEMAYENAFLQWDGSPAEMARIGQKVGADYILVGRISEARTVQGRSFYGAIPAERESIRLNWRVIEVNTGKIAAAGTVNQLQRQQMASLIHDDSPATVAELVADQVSNEVLSGLSLQVRSTAPVVSNAPLPPLSDADLTPGSSEKPVQW